MDENNLWAWYSQEIQTEEHSVTLTFAEWVGIHGALRIARKNHQMAKHPREIATEVIERIEELFGKAGMTQTELDQLYEAETGGDSGGVEAYEEEGDRARRRVRSHTR